MGTEFTFYDYIDADASGDNLIKNWLNGDGKPAKASFKLRISLLGESPPHGFMDSVWTEEYVKWMRDDWDGFIELRKSKNNVQYRILGKMIDRHVFLVAWGIHKGRRFKTSITPKTASDRVSQMMNNAKYMREHDYG